MPDNNLIPTYQEPDIYTQQYTNLLGQYAGLENEQWQSDVNFLNSSYRAYRNAINADIEAFKPYEQKTYQQALNRLQEGYQTRGLYKSGIQKQGRTEFQEERGYKRNEILRGYERMLKEAEMQFQQNVANLDFQQRSNQLGQQMSQLQFSSPYQQQGAAAIQNYPNY